MEFMLDKIGKQQILMTCIKNFYKNSSQKRVANKHREEKWDWSP